MARRGLRSFLNPVLYFGVAAAVHGLLFLLPGFKAGQPAGGTLRGVRVHSFAEIPAAGGGAPSGSVSAPPKRSVSAEPDHPVSPSGTGTAPPSPAGVGAASEAGVGGTDTTGRAGVTYGEETGGMTGDAARAPRSPSAIGEYLARLRTKDVQSWARESVGKTRREWKGAEARQPDWRTAEKTAPTGKTPERVSTVGEKYLDPRVRMVVTSYPPTSIEKRFTPVAYPGLQIKKHQLTSGWWNVYFKLSTDSDGRVVRWVLLRPETDGPRERAFVDQVRKEIARWTFDPVAAEIHVDVRFYVE